MPENFYTILTDVGKAKIANSQVTGSKVELVEMAVGDGEGAYYNPVSSQNILKNEVWRGNIAAVHLDDDNPSWIVIESVIPSAIGGFMVREAGIFDADGDMIAIGKYPSTFKPILDQGSAKDVYIRMIIEVANASAVTLKIDPTVIIASRKYVDDRVSTVEQKAIENQQNITGLNQNVAAHLADYAQFKFETENGKVSKSGDTMQGILTAHSNTSYTLRQVRNIVLSTDDADVNAMLDGDIWIKYESEV